MVGRIFVAALTLAFLAGCAKSPEGFCTDSVVAACKRMKRCNRETFERLFDSANQCTDDLLRFVNCEETTKENLCGAGESYDAFAAGACVRQTRNQECEDDTQPEACGRVCE